jgi:hypothetical protein
LLVERGASIASVDFSQVCDTEHMEILDYFISRGANMTEGNPVERSLIRQKRAGLEIFRSYGDDHPGLVPTASRNGEVSPLRE